MTRRPGRSALLIVVVVACAAVVTAFRPVGQAATPSSLRATAAGVVVAGPTCPVANAERPCPARPVAGARVALLRHGQVIAHGRTDDQGAFRLTARRGSVVVRALSPRGGYVARTSRTITLNAGSTTHVRLRLDTGIR